PPCAYEGERGKDAAGPYGCAAAAGLTYGFGAGVDAECGTSIGDQGGGQTAGAAADVKGRAGAPREETVVAETQSAAPVARVYGPVRSPRPDQRDGDRASGRGVPEDRAVLGQRAPHAGTVAGRCWRTASANAVSAHRSATASASDAVSTSRSVGP